MSSDSPKSPDASRTALSLAEVVGKWHARLDRMDYFQLLRVERPAAPGGWPSEGDLRRAFGQFAGSFHPDRFKTEAPDTRAMAEAVFRRGNEALRVLLNPDLRVRYLRGLVHGRVRLEGDELTRKPSLASMPIPDTADAASHLPVVSSAKKAAAAPVSPLESISHPAAIEFAREAIALLARGDDKKALFQLQMAASKEPDNAPLRQWLESVRGRLAAK
ncbi:MAG: hypothetical protein NVS3B10_04220 [Polyangiales bacterium]